MHLRVTNARRPFVTERDPQGHGGYYQRQPLIIILPSTLEPTSEYPGLLQVVW